VDSECGGLALLDASIHLQGGQIAYSKFLERLSISFSSYFADAPVVTAVPARVSCLEGYRVALTCSVLSVPKSDVQW
jgi:hypothetical protein